MTAQPCHAERCEHCHATDARVETYVVGGIMPGSMPLHAHTLHPNCAPLYRRGQCELCCSVIVSKTGKSRNRRGNK